MATLLQRIGVPGGADAPLFALLVNGVIGYRAVQDPQAAFQEMNPAQRLLRRITLLQLALSNTETGQRGFLLSAEVRNLSPSDWGRRSTVRRLTTPKLA